MPNMTVALPEAMHRSIRKRRTVNWSEVARRAFAEELARQEWLDEMDELTKDSKLTEADAIELGRRINRAMWKRHYEPLLAKDREKPKRDAASSSTPTG